MTASAAPRTRGDDVLILIGVFKLLKAVVLIALGVAALAGLPEHLSHTVAHATRWTGAFSGRELFQRALARVLALDERTIHKLGIASLVYAAVFTTEGVNLLRRKRWAEWLTIGVTASFIPLEIYELVVHPGLGKVAAIALNVVIVIYLVARRLADHRRRAKGSR
jgi:uncharacterized membrane protein (DUF2068 family)